MGNTSLSFDTMPFWGLVVSIVADLFFYSPFGRRLVVRA